MANSFITPQLIARRALATLYNNTVLANLVWRDYDPDFAGKQGDTVTVRTPATFTAQEYDRGDGIDVQNITEGSFPVELDTIADVSFAVTAEELTYEIDAFEERVMAPAMEAISQKVDADLAAAFSAITTPAVTGAVPSATIVDARTALSQNAVPNSDRFGVWAPEASGEILKDELFVSAEKRGDTDGLIEAAIGRKFGFDHYEANVLSGATGFAFHKTAVALVSRTLALPLGKTGDQAAVANYKGFGLRVVRDYDLDKKQDVISVDFLYGIKIIDEDRAVPVEFGAGGGGGGA